MDSSDSLIHIRKNYRVQTMDSTQYKRKYIRLVENRNDTNRLKSFFLCFDIKIQKAVK